MLNNTSSGATLIALDKVLDNRNKLNKSDVDGLMVVDTHNIRTTTDEIATRYARLMVVLVDREESADGPFLERLKLPNEALMRFEQLRVALLADDEGEELEHYAQGIRDAIAGHHDDGWNAPGVLQEAVEHITRAVDGLF